MSNVITIALAVDNRPGRARLEKLLGASSDIQLVQDVHSADILVLEARSGRDGEINRLRQTVLDFAGEVFLTCLEPSPAFLIRAMRTGIHEFLPLPVSGKELGKALTRYMHRRKEAPVAAHEPTQNGKVFVVAGVKAGLGSTSIAVNLAHELQSSAGQTALLDLRCPMGEVPLFLDLDYSYTWGDVAANLDRMDATYLKSVMSEHPSGLRVLASPGGLPAHGSDETVGRLITELRKSFANVVVDTDAGLESYGLKEVEAADETLLVMALSLPCLAHAKRVMEHVRRNGALESKIRVLVNRYIKDGDIDTHEAEEILQQKIALTIPEDYQGVLTSINQGQPLAVAAPKSPVLRAIRRLSGNMGPSDKKTKSSLLSIFRKRGNAAGLEAV